MALDLNNKFSKSIKVNLTLLINDLQKEAITDYNDSAYVDAVKKFEQILEIYEMSVFHSDDSFIDTAIIYNCGLAALNAEQFGKAIKYFKQTSQLGYNPEASYIWSAKAYKNKKDSLNALETLKEGFSIYQNDVGIMNELIQILLELDSRDEAIKYLDIAIKNSPDVNYYLIKGDLCKKNGDDENAINFYEEALAIKPENIMALYNLGVIYYNRGVKQVELAGKVPINDEAAYQKEIDKSRIWWGKSLPYIEKCHHLDPSDVTIIETLKTLYLRLRMMEKYQTLAGE